MIETLAAGLASVAAPYVSLKVRQAEKKIDDAADRIDANELRSVATREAVDPDGNLPPEPDPADERMAIVRDGGDS